MGDDVISSAIRFDIFTRQFVDGRWVPSGLTASLGTDGKMRLNGIASSTIKDLHGDTMLQSALEDMERAAAANLTIFGNHSYEVPEDVYGSVETASMKQAGTVDDAGDPIWDLGFGIVINEENPRAVATWKAINKGSKLGLSIGAMIPAGGATRDKKSGALTIAHVELLETSIVGIPANPRSWVENAVKAFTKAATSMPLGDPMLTLDTEAGTYKVEGRLDQISGLKSVGIGETFGNDWEGIATLHEACGFQTLGTMPDGMCPQCGETGPFKAFNSAEFIVGEDGPETVQNLSIQQGSEPDIVEAATCPDCGKGKGDGGGCQNSFHSKDVEPDVTDAKITVIEVDTGSPEGSSESKPAPALEDETADGDDAALGDGTTMAAAAVVELAQSTMDALEPGLAGITQQLLDLTDQLTRELLASKAAERDALAAQATAESQRDEIAKQAMGVMAKAGEIIDRLADQPVGRRTVWREAATDLANLDGIYSANFIKLLREPSEQNAKRSK